MIVKIKMFVLPLSQSFCSGTGALRSSCRLEIASIINFYLLNNVRFVYADLISCPLRSLTVATHEPVICSLTKNQLLYKKANAAYPNY